MASGSAAIVVTIEGRDAAIAQLQRLHDLLRSSLNRAPWSAEAGAWDHYFGPNDDAGELVVATWPGPRTLRIALSPAAERLLTHLEARR